MAAISQASITSLDGAAERYKLDQDFKRAADHRHKWAFGVEAKGQRSRPEKSFGVTDLSPRAREREHKKAIKATRRANASPAPQNSKANIPSIRRKQPVGRPENAMTESSAEDEVEEPSAATEPDAGITYSFDAARGPNKGSDILSMAINKAVERYETKATEKLVRDEYDVVSPDEEKEHEGYTADEDDFELL